jgi:hypothetical protein
MSWAPTLEVVVKLKRVFNGGERAVYEMVHEIVGHLQASVFPKMRVADVLRIERSGISDRYYTYALKAHFDFVVADDQGRPKLAIEFDGSGHDPVNDHLKNDLCERFGLPLVRITSRHLRARNFEHTAVAFLIYQLFGVESFLEQFGDDPYETYDPMFFVSVPGSDRNWPFAFAARHQSRLGRRLQEHLDLVDEEVREPYRHGLFSLLGVEGAWERDGHFRAVCGLPLGRDRIIAGTAELGFSVFGMEDEFRRCFLNLSTFVVGLAGASMYESGMDLLTGGEVQPGSRQDLRVLRRRWEGEGFRLRIGMNLPQD